MKAEIITIGTELVQGKIHNTNTTFLSQELSQLGIECNYHTSVGDYKDNIQDCLQQSINRSELIIISGGLGPTPDDITIETIAELFKQDLVTDDESIKDIKEFFKKRNKAPIADSNYKQALRPADSVRIPNPTGTAPGIIWEISKYINKETKTYILTLPGVPSEMKNMWNTTIKPFLNNINSNQYIKTKDIKLIGIGESNLTDRISHILNITDPNIATLASVGECKICITAKGSTQEEASEKLSKISEQIYKEIPEYIYGEDEDTLESKVAQLLSDHGYTLSTAESCTGGLLSQRLTSIPGSSQFIGLNLATYSNESKSQLLNVNNKDLEKYGAVSKPVAIQMAKGTRELSKSNIGIGITGIAGPGSDNTNKPVGLVYIGISTEESTEVYEYQFGNIGRDNVRWLTTQNALDLIRKTLLK